MKEIIKQILDLAVFAASGDNSQPWRFETENNKIYLYNLPEKDNPVLNFEQSGSYIAHGGVIENISIIAKHLGYRTNINLFPQNSDQTLVAVIALEPCPAETEELYEFIKLRHTNRKIYQKTPLTNTQKQTLQNTLQELQMSHKARIVLLEQPNEIKSAAAAGSSMEQVILENQTLHELLFKDVLWTEEENKKKISGLYIKTMEFPPPVKFIFWLAGFWPIMRIFNKLGLAKFIAWQDAKLYSSCGAMAAIIISNHAKENFIDAGRITQRLWLKATQMNLYLQPITATLFAGRRLEVEKGNFFSQKHQTIIQKNFNQLKHIFNLQPPETIAMMMRIGYADPPSGLTLRFPPLIKEKKDT